MNDYINREDTIKHLTKHLPIVFATGLEPGTRTAERLLGNIPSADVEPSRPNGEWTLINDKEMVTFNPYRCSSCGRVNFITFLPRYKYCPCCGARMNVEEGEFWAESEYPIETTFVNKKEINKNN